MQQDVHRIRRRISLLVERDLTSDIAPPYVCVNFALIYTTVCTCINEDKEMLPACPPLIYFYLKPFYLIWQYTLENICQCGLYCPGRILLSQKSSKSLQTQARGIFPRMFICNVTAVFSTAVHATFTGIWVSFQHGEHCSGNTDAGPSISTHHWYAHIATAVAAVSF